jgi:hypothetical protein
MRRSDLVYEELPEENELMLVDEGAGRVTVLNSTAGGVWLLCDGERSIDELSGFLRELFPDVPEDQARGQVEQTLEFLADEGLLE